MLVLDPRQKIDYFLKLQWDEDVLNKTKNEFEKVFKEYQTTQIEVHWRGQKWWTNNVYGNKRRRRRTRCSWILVLWCHKIKKERKKEKEKEKEKSYGERQALMSRDYFRERWT